MADILAQVTALGKTLDTSGAAQGLSDAANAAANAAEAEISNTLGGIGILPDDVKAAATAFKNLPSGATNAVLHMATTGQVSLTTVAPILAMGLAATGVGAPAAAIVAAALPIVDAIGHALGLFGDSAPHFDWIVGQQGFVGHIPYGPTDSLWTPLSQMIPPTQPNSDIPSQYVSGPVPRGFLASGATIFPAWNRKPDFTAIDRSFPEYRNIESDLLDLSVRFNDKTNMAGDTSVNAAHLKIKSPNRFNGWPKGARDFAMAFYGAWKADAEKAINGHKRAGSSAILTAVISGWNRGHSDSETFTISPKHAYLWNQNPDNPWGPWARYIPSTVPPAPYSDLYRETCASYIEGLLSGDIDNIRRPPIVLNIGPRPSDVPKPKLVTAPPLHIQGALLGSKNPVAPRSTTASILRKSPSSATPWLLAALGIGAVLVLKRR